MIRSRRRAHQRAFATLAVVLPALFVAAVWLRPKVPAAGGDGDDLLRASGYAPSAIAEPAPIELGGPSDYRVEVMRRAGSRAALVLDPFRAPLRPDVLVYWTPSDEVASSLPADAILLGSLAGASARGFDLPSAFDDTAGTLVLYSLGHQTTLATISLDGASADGVR